MGKVPALKHGDVVVTEAAAICCYLADEFPQARLNVPVGHPRRGPYLKWLFFGPSCIEPAMVERAFPRKEAAPTTALGFGDVDGFNLGSFLIAILGALLVLVVWRLIARSTGAGSHGGLAHR